MGVHIYLKPYTKNKNDFLSLPLYFESKEKHFIYMVSYYKQHYVGGILCDESKAIDRADITNNETFTIISLLKEK